MSSSTKRGRVAVGRRVYGKNKTFVDPSLPSFTPIVSLTATTPYGCLGPYLLRDSQNHILENVWQFAKLYAVVPKTSCRKNAYDKTVIWDWPAQVHWDETAQRPTPEYWRWRAEGMACPHPVRYPVGYHHRHKCMGLILDDADSDPSAPFPPLLGYIESRRQLYLPMYQRAVIHHPAFVELSERLDKGENLLIIEVDGPHQESLAHYQETYGVGDDFIAKNNTMEATEESLRIMLQDALHPFGHGYVFASMGFHCFEHVL